MRHQIANGNNNNEIRKNEKEAVTHGGTRHINAGALIFSMGIFLVALIIVATAIGVVSIPFTQTIKIILSNWGIRFNESIPAGMNSIVYFIRLPRVLTAVLVGAALGTCGAVMQGMFRNPMADPGILGISSGAGLGAVIAIAAGLTAKSLFFLPASASAGALVAAAIIFLLSSRGGKMQSVTLVLTGIAVSMFLGSATTFVLNLINSNQVKQFIFWTMGSFNATQWVDVKIAIIPVIVGIFLLNLFARDLNMLQLGEEESTSSGLNPTATRRIVMIISSITTAAAVCVSGTISFVGLIVPHIMRLLLGPDHKRLLPASAVGGAILLVFCDLLGRTIMEPNEISVGIITSFLGAPYFLYLLRRARREMYI